MRYLFTEWRMGYPCSWYIQLRRDKPVNDRGTASRNGSLFRLDLPLAFILFKVLKATVGLRVSPEEEKGGLDLAEHGGNAYPDFEYLPIARDKTTI